ncbi:MAG: DUF2812 domain-containing protein, partial [Gordonia sp. (in: high G+C Gram-positive bacteria)]
LSPVRMTFVDSAPAQVRYAVERRAVPAPVDYFRFREQEGWEHVGNALDFHLWRRTYTGDRPAGFIGERLDERASRFGQILAITAAIAAIATVILGVIAGTDTFASISVNFWAPAIVSGIIFLITACGAISMAISTRKAASEVRTPDARTKARV